MLVKGATGISNIPQIIFWELWLVPYIDGLMQKTRDFIAGTLDLCLLH